jgi:hypothetical protein
MQTATLLSFDFFEAENLSLQLDDTITTTIFKSASLKSWNMYMYNQKWLKWDNSNASRNQLSTLFFKIPIHWVHK